MDLAWIAPAIGTTIVYAGITIGDKLILTRLRIGLTAFYFFTGAAQFVTALIVFAVYLPGDLPMRSSLEAYGGGLCWGTGLMLMFWALTREEVSRVAPLWHTSPVFVAVVAVFLLGESLENLHWVAIALVVFGAAAVSIRGGDLRSGFGFSPTYAVVLAGAVIIGTGQLLLKESSDDMTVWPVMAFRALGLATAMCVPFLRRDTLRDLVRFMRSPRNALAISINDGIGPFFGNLLLLWAIADGPISLVSAVLGTRPVFVLAGAMGLSKLASDLLDERMTRSDVAIKAIATAAVVAGVVIIALA